MEHPDAGAEGAEASSGSGYMPLAQAVWARVDGAVGLVASLRCERDFARLSLIQDAIASGVPSQDGLPHGAWRDVWTEVQGASPHRGFVDGDLIESYLGLPRQAQQAIANALEAGGVATDGVEGLLREIEELARLH